MTGAFVIALSSPRQLRGASTVALRRRCDVPRTRAPAAGAAGRVECAQGAAGDDPPPSANTAPVAAGALLEPVLEGLGRGLERELSDEEESAVDDVVEALEDVNPHPAALRDPASRALVEGDWVLIYTNSSTTRFAKGFSGAHGYLPQGESVAIRQHVDLVFDELTIEEDLRCFPNVALKATAKGEFEVRGDAKYVWDPEVWLLGPMKNQASGNRVIRSFCVGEVTFLDGTYRIDRGTTDQVYIWKRRS